MHEEVCVNKVGQALPHAAVALSLGSLTAFATALRVGLAADVGRLSFLGAPLTAFATELRSGLAAEVGRLGILRHTFSLKS